MAWKEIKKNKARFMILGSIVFLVSLLTFMISGLANGLSQDNAALIKELPEGTFYMTEEANELYHMSSVDRNTQDHMRKQNEEAAAFSIQMGFLVDDANTQRSVAFVTSTPSEWFKQVNQGEIILDRSMEDEGITVGDALTNNQYNGELIVKGFVDQSKFSHAPVAYIHPDDYKEMYRADAMQLIFVPGDGSEQIVTGLQSFTKKEFLHTIPSYKAEQLSLSMIVWFLVVISGMLFAIFFYMMNVQKVGLYGILKAIGVKTSTLFKMMWTQMLFITMISLSISTLLVQIFHIVAPKGMPFHLPIETTLQLSIVFLAIGFFGATLSGLQIRKVEPLHAIQQGEM